MCRKSAQTPPENSGRALFVALPVRTGRTLGRIAGGTRKSRAGGMSSFGASRLAAVPERIPGQNTPQWPCEPRYNLPHNQQVGRLHSALSLPTSSAFRRREACKPRTDIASRITKCGLKKGPSQTPQGILQGYRQPLTRSGVGKRAYSSSSSRLSSSCSMKRSYTALSSSSLSGVDRISSPFS